MDRFLGESPSNPAEMCGLYVQIQGLLLGTWCIVQPNTNECQIPPQGTNNKNLVPMDRMLFLLFMGIHCSQLVRNCFCPSTVLIPLSSERRLLFFLLFQGSVEVSWEPLTIREIPHSCKTTRHGVEIARCNSLNTRNPSVKCKNNLVCVCVWFGAFFRGYSFFAALGNQKASPPSPPRTFGSTQKETPIFLVVPSHASPWVFGCCCFFFSNGSFPREQKEESNKYSKSLRPFAEKQTTQL